MLCELLDVSRSGFYAWLKRRPSDRSLETEELLAEIRDCVVVGRGAYGSPRVHRELKRRGRHVGRKRVERLMRENGLKGRKRRRFKTTTLSQHNLQTHRNVLKREFSVKRANDVWGR